jgi:hypothetical protein
MTGIPCRVGGVDPLSDESGGMPTQLGLQRILQVSEPLDRITEAPIMSDQQVRELVLLIKAGEHLQENGPHFPGESHLEPP